MIAARQHVIIGAGAAGMAAAEVIRRRDPHAAISLVSEERESYYSRPGLAYMLTGELGEKQLYPFNDHEFQRLNIHRLHASVLRIDPRQRQIELVGSRALPYDSLLIATGSRAALVNLPNIEAEGVVKLDNVGDARHIMKLCAKARSAVVVGGGITALEIVEGLTARGLKPDYFLRGDRYWNNVLDETESRIVEHRLKEEGVRLHYHTELAEIITRNGRVYAVVAKDGRQFRCDLLAVAIGVLPRSELASASGLRVDKGIQVDAKLETEHSGIFAAGDVAEVIDPLTGKTQMNTLWPLAREQGRIAGYNMSIGAGESGQPYRSSVPFNVTRLAGLTVTIIGTVGRGKDDDLIGIARGDSETWRQLPDAIAAQANFDVNRLRVLVGERSLIGAVVMGDQTLSRPLQQLISRQVEITPIRDRLLERDVPLADVLADYWARVCNDL